ncbi:MAG: SPOR domain-containing protein [Gammaproteobacteria bacterium]|nr:SPOR domain-containing protein [Gammaproteobacteria bacterium]
MPRDYAKQKSRKKPSSRGSKYKTKARVTHTTRRGKNKKPSFSHWKLWLLTIFLIAIFILCLVAVSHHATKPKIAAVSKIPVKVKATHVKNNTIKQKPKFYFYTLLPKEQVNVAKLTPKINGKQYFLQVAAVKDADAADHLKAELALLGFDVYIDQIKVQGQKLNRVNIGPYSSKQAAKTDQKRLTENKIQSILHGVRSGHETSR